MCMCVIACYYIYPHIFINSLKLLLIAITAYHILFYIIYTSVYHCTLLYIILYGIIIYYCMLFSYIRIQAHV
jgi:hypothetical protein